MSIDFGNLDQVRALRSVLRDDVAVQAALGSLTSSEVDELKGQLGQLVTVSISTPAQGQQVYAAYKTMLGELAGNSFKVETLVQKADVAAASGTAGVLRGQINTLRARVEYLSDFGADTGAPYLSAAQARLVNGYLDRAQSRLGQYDNRGGSLTTQEAAAVRAALSGTAEAGDPAGGAVALIQRILDPARLT